MRLWIAAAVLLVLAVIGLVAIPYGVDWDGYRSDIEATATRLTGHEVAIGGPIEVALLPRPTLTARDVTMVGTTEGAIGFELSANLVEMGLRPGPLLAGRPIADNLKLNRPVLTVDQAGSRQLRSWPPRWQDWIDPLLKPDLRAISIVDGRLQLAADQTGDGFAIRDLTLKLAIAKPKGPLEAAGLFKTDHYRFSIAADMGEPAKDGAGTLKVKIDAQNGIDEKTTLNFSGVFKRDDDDQGVRGNLDVRGPDLQNGLQAIAAATGYPSTFLWLAPGQPFDVRGRIEADRQGIAADEIKLTLDGKLGGGMVDLAFHPRTTLDLDLDLPTVRLADDTTLIDFVPLDLLSAFPAAPGAVDIRLREVVYRDNVIRRARIKLETGTDRITHVEQASLSLPGLLDARFKGTVRRAERGPILAGQLGAAGDDLGATLHWLELVDGDRGGWGRGFSLETDFEVTHVEIALSGIDMRLDSSKLQGAASLRYSERLKLGLDMDVDRLNLDLYPGATSAAGLVENLAMSFDEVDASVDIRFQRLAWLGLRFEAASIKANAEAGRVTLASLAARTVGDTALVFEGEVDLNTRNVDLSAELSSRFPTRILRYVDADLPLSSLRLEPVTLTGWVKGRLDGFDVAVQASYDRGDWLVEGSGGWIDKQPRYDLSIEARHPDHQTLIRQFGLAPLLPAGDASGPFEIAARLSHDPEKSWTTTGSAKLGPTTITGSLTRQHAKPRARWEANLSIGNPRRDSLAPFLSLAGIRLPGVWTPKTWLGRLPHTGFRTAWLDDADGSLTLMSKGGLAGDGITLSARLNQGFLYVDRLDARPWQGTLHAELSLERRRGQPYAAIALDLDDVDAVGFARWLGIPDVIDAPLDLKLEAMSVGRTPHGLVAALAGDIEIDIGEGKIQGFDIKPFKHVLSGTTGTISSTGPGGAFDRASSIPLASLKVEAGLSRGIAEIGNGQMVIESEADEPVMSTINGTVDFLLWIAELTIMPENVDGDEAEPSAYRLVGPPDRPAGLISSGKR